MIYRRPLPHRSFFPLLIGAVLYCATTYAMRGGEAEILRLMQGKIKHNETTEITVTVEGQDVKFGVAKTILELGVNRPDRVVNVIYATRGGTKIAVLMQFRAESEEPAVGSAKTNARKEDQIVPKDLAKRILSRTGPIVALKLGESRGAPKKQSGKMLSVDGKLMTAFSQSPFKTVITVESGAGPKTFVIDPLTAIEKDLVTGTQVKIQYISVNKEMRAMDIEAKVNPQRIRPAEPNSKELPGAVSDARPGFQPGQEGGVGDGGNQALTGFAIFGMTKHQSSAWLGQARGGAQSASSSGMGPSNGKGASDQGLDSIIKRAQKALESNNWQEAKSSLYDLIQADPGRWEFYQALGYVNFNTGQLDEAIHDYDVAIQTAARRSPEGLKAEVGEMLLQQGYIYSRMGKTKEALDTYTKAASWSPNPAVPYFYLCATQYNSDDMAGAITACDKAISTEPKYANSYLIKGLALYATGDPDQEGAHWVAPIGTREALNKYLELAPNGEYAATVKSKLASLSPEQK
jgi:Flp pilus assembly protein TadD